MKVKDGQKTEDKRKGEENRSENIVLPVLTSFIVLKLRAGSQVVMWASSGDKARRVELHNASSNIPLHNE